MPSRSTAASLDDDVGCGDGATLQSFLFKFIYYFGRLYIIILITQTQINEFSTLSSSQA